MPIFATVEANDTLRDLLAVVARMTHHLAVEALQIALKRRAIPVEMPSAAAVEALYRRKRLELLHRFSIFV